jgi:uncharacterized protein (UPF0248 family)
MKPIHEILSRIRWDKEYAKADFRVGYYDRVENRLILVPFHDLWFDDEDRFGFQVLDGEGVTHHIPLHRVKAVYRNDELIWHRDEGKSASEK